jgi:hypothetical protein
MLKSASGIRATDQRYHCLDSLRQSVQGCRNAIGYRYKSACIGMDKLIRSTLRLAAVVLIATSGIACDTDIIIDPVPDPSGTLSGVLRENDSCHSPHGSYISQGASRSIVAGLF